MPDINDGDSVEIQGSAKDPYILKNLGGVYSCSCPAWRNQSTPIEKRTCKHLRKYRGDQAELDRLGGELPDKPVAYRRKATTTKASGENGELQEEASNVPAILLAHSWDNSLDLTGWWMSEKLDGVRAYWDGKQFISRQGNIYMAPDWFVEDLPNDIHLDGELWIARKAFQKTVSIVRRQDRSKEWEAVKYVVFDAPLINDIFEARIAFIQQCLDEARPRYARPHEQERCKSTEHLKEELKRVEEGGGEGLMLRQPNSKYETGRSFTLLKVKSFHDAEARVLEHLPGTGKHKGRMGALSVELNDGTKFAIGTGFSDRERDNPPPIGSIVTFRYQELTDRGVPRFPSYVRLRTDIDKLPDSSQLSDVGGSVLTIQVTESDESVGNSLTPNQVASSTDSSPSTKSALAAPPTTAATSSSSSNSSSSSQKEDATGNATKKAAEAPASNVVAFAPRKAKVDETATAGETRPKTYDTSSPRYFEFTEGSSSKFWTIWRIDSVVTVRFGKIGTTGQEKPKSFSDEAAANKYYNEIIGEKTDKGYVEKTGPGGETVGFHDDHQVDLDDDVSEDSDGSDDDVYDDSEAGDDGDVCAESEDGDHAQSDDDQSERRLTGSYNNLLERGPVTCYCSKCRPDLAGARTSVASEASVPSKSSGFAAKDSNVAISARKAPVKTISSGGANFRYFEFVEGSSSKFWSIAMVGNDVTVKYGRIGTSGQEKTKSFATSNAAQKYYDDIVEEKVEKGYEEKDNDDD